MKKIEKFIKVAVLENEFEADLIGSVLTERNIPHQLQSYHDTAYDGLFQTQLGWGNIYAPSEFKKEIMEIINDIRK